MGFEFYRKGDIQFVKRLQLQHVQDDWSFHKEKANISHTSCSWPYVGRGQRLCSNKVLQKQVDQW